MIVPVGRGNAHASDRSGSNKGFTNRGFDSSDGWSRMVAPPQIQQFSTFNPYTPIFELT